MVHFKEREPEASARMVRPEQEEWVEVHETPVHTNKIEWQRWEEAAPVGHKKKSISSGTCQAHVPHTLIQKFSERLQHFLHAAASLCSPAYAPLTQLNQAAFVINPRSVFYDLSYFLPGIFFDIHHAIPTIRVYSVPAAKTTQISRGGMNQSTNIMYVCMCMCMCMYLCAYL